MVKAPPDIRITDLARPVLSAGQRQALEFAASLSVTLSVEAVLEEAERQTGLHYYGADDFRSRLELWLQSTDEDSGLNNLGRNIVFGDCARYAANRLRLEDLLRQHPEILDEKILRPLIIVGLPRSGTTHLVNMISTDRRLHTVPYWESREPVPAAGEAPGDDGEDPRRVRCREQWALMDMMLPHLKNMHEMSPDHVHEELELENLDFSSYHLEWMAQVPRWRDHYLACDQRPHYAYMKKVLQVLQWRRGPGEPKRWLLKSPQHLEQLGPLLDTFADASLAITHRDPVAVVLSIATMLAYGDRMRRRQVNPRQVISYWIDRIERLLRACVRDRELAPATHSLDVLFHEFMADEQAMVERFYRVAELPITADVQRSLGQYLKDNPRGKYGRMIYDAREDFALEPEAIRERFSFYFDRFPVRAETG